MKRTIAVGTILAALVLPGGAAFGQGSSQGSQQSLGDAARVARQKKAQMEPATRQYDNDNLPTNETLSVVGPEPATATDQKAAEQQSAAASAAAAEKSQQNAQEMQSKLDAQKAKIDQLSHELDLDQREYRMRAAVFYSDAGNRLREATQWDKDDARYKAEIETKQKALDDAKAQMVTLQEDARKAGVKEPEPDAGAKDSNKANTDDSQKDESKK
ncbi:MAG: hypothetical protein WCB53_10365 [Terriglobales bacterium]